ncbi:MAG: ATP-binding protein [Deltaproteobacteria bacterium]|nr:ATP-binding protein [Deltaproteobacteria bacterium]
MVFVGGPRQVGKTTLCIQFLNPPHLDNRAYLNWDDLESKSMIRNGNLPPDPLVVLDEIHKYTSWRNLVKGFYDKKKEVQKFLITGSARLDYYRRGGDSLMGRYRYLRLHPFSLPELKLETVKDMEPLIKFGGFPEPLFSQNEREWKLWTRERLYRVVNDDIRDLEGIRDFNKIELLAEHLPDRVGSPLSINNIANDLAVNHRTAEHWIGILERVYYCFRIPPYGPKKINAVKKEQKLYLWDWSVISPEGVRFENLVASHLLKYCHFHEDTQGDKMELRFLRDVEKREVDFVVLKNSKPLFAVECKTGERVVSPHLRYFSERTTIPLFFQVHLGKKDFAPDAKIRVLPFPRFCQESLLI